MAFQFKQGKYVGNGASSQAITGIGFQPKAVFIFAANYTGWQSAIYKTDTMSTGLTSGGNSNFGENGYEQSGKISSLDADGFTLGGVNSAAIDGGHKNGQTYYYVAIGGDDVKTGTYTGNGSSSRAITGVGFQPEVLMVQGGNAHSYFKTKASGVSTDSAARFSGPGLGPQSNTVKSLDADGFTVGSAVSSVNDNGVAFHYLALKTAAGIKSGQYSGNGSDNRNITGVGFQPQFVILKNEQGGSDRPADVSVATTEERHVDSGDSTLPIRNGDAPFANGVQDFVSDGFQVGSEAAVNESGVTIDWFALGVGTTQHLKTLAVNAAATLALTGPATLLKSIVVTATAVPKVLKGLSKTLGVTAIASVLMSKPAAHLKSLQVTATGYASMIHGFIYVKTMVATAAAVTALSALKGRLVEMVATAAATVSIATQGQFVRSLVATAEATVSITRAIATSIQLVATAVAAPVITASKALSVYLTVIATGLPAVTKQLTLSMIMQAVASAATRIRASWGYLDKYPDVEDDYQDKYPNS